MHFLLLLWRLTLPNWIFRYWKYTVWLLRLPKRYSLVQICRYSRARGWYRRGRHIYSDHYKASPSRCICIPLCMLKSIRLHWYCCRRRMEDWKAYHLHKFLCIFILQAHSTTNIHKFLQKAWIYLLYCRQGRFLFLHFLWLTCNQGSWYKAVLRSYLSGKYIPSWLELVGINLYHKKRRGS